MSSGPYDDFSKINFGNRPTLTGAFGKVCAVTSLAATIAFYVGAAQLGGDIYDNYEASKDTWNDTPAATVLEPKKDHMTWGQEGLACAVSLAAGFTGIALGKKRRRNSALSAGYDGGYYNNSNDGFMSGYMWGSMSSSGGSSSSSDGKAALAVGAIILLGAGAAGTAVVSYKALKANFGNG